MRIFLVLPVLLCLGIGIVSGARAEEMVLISPFYGSLNSESAGGSGTAALSDRGPLYGLNMLYARPNFSIGSMGHYSKLDFSTENGYLFYLTYYFQHSKKIQPMLGFSGEYIHIFTAEDAAMAAPLNSLNVDTSVWAFHPIIGLSFKLDEQRITPFVGYFSEQIETSVVSEGMSVGGRTQNGFSSKSSVVLNYISAGSMLDFVFYHFIRFNTKFYWRFKDGDQIRFAARNRLDLFVSQNAGISFKYDYFDDKYEKNAFATIGPTFIL